MVQIVAIEHVVKHGHGRGGVSVHERIQSLLNVAILAIPSFEVGELRVWHMCALATMGQAALLLVLVRIRSSRMRRKLE